MDRSEQLVEALAASRDDLSQRFVATLLAGDDAPRRTRREAEVREAVEGVIDLIVESLRGEPLSTAEVLDGARPIVHQAQVRGVSGPELRATGRHVMRLVWDTLVDAAGDDPAGREAVIELTPSVIDIVEAVLAIVDAAISEVEQARASATAAVDAELVAALVTGRTLGRAAAAAAKRYGLGDGTPIVVVVARPCPGTDDRVVLELAARELTRAMEGPSAALAARYDGDVVLIRPLRDREGPLLAERATEAATRLSRRGHAVRVGGSAPHDRIAGCADAYAEALTAIEHSEDGGVLLYWTLSAPDYLVLRAQDATAWRLVPAPVRQLVVADLAGAGKLVATIQVYVDANLDITAAAQRLSLHRGSVQYRLRAIAERTGCDLRNVRDLQMLLVAIGLAKSLHPGEGDREHH